MESSAKPNLSTDFAAQLHSLPRANRCYLAVIEVSPICHMRPVCNICVEILRNGLPCRSAATAMGASRASPNSTKRAAANVGRHLTGRRPTTCSISPTRLGFARLFAGRQGDFGHTSAVQGHPGILGDWIFVGIAQRLVGGDAVLIATGDLVALLVGEELLD